MLIRGWSSALCSSDLGSDVSTSEPQLPLACSRPGWPRTVGLVIGIPVRTSVGTLAWSAHTPYPHGGGTLVEDNNIVRNNSAAAARPTDRHCRRGRAARRRGASRASARSRASDPVHQEGSRSEEHKSELTS